MDAPVWAVSYTHLDVYKRQCPSMVRASQCTEIDSGMEKRHFTEKEKKLIGWAAIVIFVVFTAAVCWFVGRPMGKFVSEPEKFRLWVESHGLWSQRCV